MVLMLVLGALLIVGVTLTLRWGGTAYEPWSPGDGGPVADRPPLRTVGRGYLRGVAIALVGGFWAGALVTGPAVRLIMRLLAATAGDGAQGLLTEAEEVVGNIDLGGTIGLYLFGGIFPGLLSGALYLVFRRWLPAGRLGGVAFGALHLVIAATRLDPLRPGNPDFDLVGPGWLAVVTFSLAAVFHGMAVVALVNRYSTRFPPPAGSRASRVRSVLPLVLPALLLIPGAFLVFPLTIGLVATLVASRIPPVGRALRSGAAVVAGRIALAVVALAFLPGAVVDLHDVIVRDPPAVSSPSPTAAPAPGPS
ncbi:MAG: hypothetical protein QOH36_2229 [Actinomycetota bacterium]|nr:hypothetical protein [Actinomycetota bacterium]